MHYYQFNIGDFIKDSAHLTLEEEAIYRRLIDLYYTTEKLISLDINIVSRSIRARGKEDLIDIILNEFFVKTDKGFKQKRIEKELKNYKEKSKKAKASAEARWNRSSKPCATDANALRTDSESIANHEPLTTNHKPITNNKKTDKIPYSAIAELYNNEFANNSGNSHIAKLTDKRKRLIKTAWNFDTDSTTDKFLTNNLDYWKRYFSYCSTVEFFKADCPRANGHENWCPDFEFIIKPDTQLKCREGKYK